MSILCRVGYHRWARWEQFDKTTQFYLNGNVIARSAKPKQRRVCDACGLVQVRAV